MNRQRPDARAAGWLYLAASHAATLALFAFFTLLACARELGSRPDCGNIRNWRRCSGSRCLRWHEVRSVPFDIWLRPRHANAPSSCLGLLSGVTPKWVFTACAPQRLAAGAGRRRERRCGAGVISAVLGVAFALGQHDLKTPAGLSTVWRTSASSSSGWASRWWRRNRGIRRGGNWHWRAGCCMYGNHGLFKALLFLGAGSVLHATGTREMSRLGGLWRAMPWTAGLSRWARRPSPVCRRSTVCQ